MFIEPTVVDLDTSSRRPTLFGSDGSPDLKPVYEALSLALLSQPTDSEGTLLVLDGLAELLHIGFEPESISRFMRATLALARKVVDHLCGRVVRY